MSILGKIVEFVAPDLVIKALDVPIKALDKVSKKIDNKNQASKRKLFECAPGEKALLINQEMFTWRDKFNIYDDSENVKYSVKGEFSSIKHHLHIYDSCGKEIGFVKEKLLTLRPSAIIESHPCDFDLEIHGKRAGKLKSKWAFGKSKYSLDNGWEIEGNFIGWKYKISDGDRTVATMSYKPLYWGDTYLITYPETENDLLILMIVLAIDIANAPKRSEELKSTIHHKSHYWL